jgi:hypothetical protein
VEVADDNEEINPKSVKKEKIPPTEVTTHIHT